MRRRVALIVALIGSVVLYAALAGMGIPGKRQVIDTSRNGGASGDWCADDNTDRRIGRYPTLDTGDAGPPPDRRDAVPRDFMSVLVQAEKKRGES